ISGMTVATVLLTALIFYAVGWTGAQHRVLALSIGGVVCIAAAVAGATSQDLKTGLLVGGIIQFLDRAGTTIVPRSFPGVTVAAIDSGPYRLDDGQQFRVGHVYE